MPGAFSGNTGRVEAGWRGLAALVEWAGPPAPRNARMHGLRCRFGLAPSDAASAPRIMEPPGVLLHSSGCVDSTAGGGHGERKG